MQSWLTNVRIFTGHEWIEEGHVCVEAGRIIAVTTELPADASDPYDCRDHWLVPAFIDAQVYGGGGKLFSQYPHSQSLELLKADNRKGGTTQCLVTIATQPFDTILQCLDALNEYLNAGGEGILGLHLEGPFIHEAKRGAHNKDWVRVPTTDDISMLLDRAKGRLKMITVAPECCPDEVLQMLNNAGVIISAGHSNANYAEAKQFSGRGVKAITHLYNAMTPLHHRDPGIAMAAFEDEGLTASIIADGKHADYSMVRMAKQLMQDRLFYITDAVTPTHEGPYQHLLQSDHYALPDGTLSGSSLTMLQAVKNGIEYAGISLDESLRMAGLYPATLLGISQDYGSIAPGKKAAMLLLQNDLELVAMIGE
ncbi:MAG TPA: N-acetylglucosamine-6-phosphate deacetylase [Phnomibacter sp.]|nr:N-acetylglucosamine-6-phosphate deacetylase [Phnomibacter sp.]